MDENKTIKTDVRLSEIKFIESLYPRMEHNPALVQQYAENILEIQGRGNYISVSKDLTLLDGRHRYLAYAKRAAWRSGSNGLPLKSGQSSGCGRKMWTGVRGFAPAESCSPLRTTSRLATSRPA
jgi:hypothetical protein